MPVSVEEFVKAPSQELLEELAKDNLLRVAEHYEIEIPDKRVRESSIRTAVIAGLIEHHVFVCLPRPGACTHNGCNTGAHVRPAERTGDAAVSTSGNKGTK